MKPLLSIFQYAIKFKYRFLAMIQFSFWFMSFIFDKIAPPPKWTFQNMLWIIFLSLFSAKNSLRRAKTWYFLILHFVRQAGYSPPPAYAIEYMIYITIQALNLHGSVP